jgi:hypothetical protein
MLEKFGRARGNGNQGFQRGAEVALALLMLLNA